MVDELYELRQHWPRRYVEGNSTAVSAAVGPGCMVTRAAAAASRYAYPPFKWHTELPGSAGPVPGPE